MGDHCSLGHGGKQFLLFAKMPVKRWLLYTQPFCQLPRADGVQSHLIKQVKRLGNDGFAIQLVHLDNLSVIGNL